MLQKVTRRKSSRETSCVCHFNKRLDLVTFCFKFRLHKSSKYLLVNPPRRVRTFRNWWVFSCDISFGVITTVSVVFSAAAVHLNTVTTNAPCTRLVIPKHIAVWFTIRYLCLRIAVTLGRIR